LKENIMTTHEDRGRRQDTSRRQMLQALAGAVAGVIGRTREAFGQKPDPNPEGQGMGAARAPSIDIHAHYFPETYLNVFNEDGKRFNAEYRMTEKGFYYKCPIREAGPQSIRFIDLKQRIADMDRQGIEVQAISLTNPMTYWGDEVLSHKLAVAWNDGASAAHLAYPNRLVALLTLPMLYPDRAVDELNRASKLPGMRGVYAGCNVNNKDLDDPLFEPIWARIEELDLPVFLHPIETGKLGGEQRLGPFYLSNLLGNPFDTAIAACHLIFGGVLDRHPKLQVCLAHGGGALPILIGRIDHGWQVRPETRHLPQAPSTYLRRFTYDTIVHSKPIMEFLIAEVGADRIMIGSDYCADMGYERPVQFLDEISLTSAGRRMILGGTARGILKL
jgi:aminocarboxymuconate-semialdehyde decarboxylase